LNTLLLGGIKKGEYTIKSDPNANKAQILGLKSESELISKRLLAKVVPAI
jgi:hypothetical protein